MSKGKTSTTHSTMTMATPLRLPNRLFRDVGEFMATAWALRSYLGSFRPQLAHFHSCPAIPRWGWTAYALHYSCPPPLRPATDRELPPGSWKETRPPECPRRA